MNREQLKALAADADSLTDKALLRLAALPAPFTAVAVASILLAAIAVGAWLS